MSVWRRSRDRGPWTVSSVQPALTSVVVRWAPSGAWVGYVRAAAYGYTLGGPVALAQVSCQDGVSGEWLKAGDFTVRADQREWPAKLQIAPFYDPKRLRILAEG